MQKKRIIVTILFSLLVVAGGVLTILRYDAWFGNYSEDIYQTPKQPHNIVLTCGEDATSERFVSWRADTVLKTSSVELIGSNNVISIPAVGQLLTTEGGKAAFYKAHLTDLTVGEYSYRCITANDTSAFCTFTLVKDTTEQFLLFGDVQDRVVTSSAAMYNLAFDTYPNVQYVAYVGDILERPMDKFWQEWFVSLGFRQAHVPIIAATGNHDYHKGVIKTLDSRWTKVFVNPENGPYRYLGRSYFVDTQFARVVVLDTDGLFWLSDYTITSTWLRRVLHDNAKRWNIVIMHHPVYAAREGRVNPTIYAAFVNALKEADVVFCGHDHNYVRQGEKPVYVLTSSADKLYPIKKDLQADYVLSGEKVYEYVKLGAEYMIIKTHKVTDNVVCDSVRLVK